MPKQRRIQPFELREVRLTDANIDEAEIATLCDLEAAVENARRALSVCLAIPRQFKPDDIEARDTYIDRILQAAGHATQLGTAAGHLADHLCDRARRLLTDQLHAIRQESPMP